MLQNVRGTTDFFGISQEVFQYIISVCDLRGELYNFSNIQLPIFECEEVFLRSIGEESDIVSKEIYSFKDKGDNKLALRPEFTAGVVRFLLSNKLYNNTLPLRFFTYGPLFRYERPQKGRKRQFHQINYEVFYHPESDDHVKNSYLLEIIKLAQDILKNLQLLNDITLKINCLGDKNSRKNFTDALYKFLLPYESELSIESQKRLKTNPLRILDSKSTSDQAILNNGPKIEHYLDEQTKNKFMALQDMLQTMNINFVCDPKLVRGLDYYSDVVFEFTTDSLGAQNAVLAGGTYDNLVGEMNNNKHRLSAVGFAGGIERMMEMILQQKENYSFLCNKKYNNIAILPININQELPFIMHIAQELREAKFVTTIIHEKNLKKQLQNAVKNNFHYALIVGEDELKNKKFIVRDLENSSQEEVVYDDLIYYLKNKFNA